MKHSPEGLLASVLEQWKTYETQNNIDNDFKERCYVFIVQWILLWGGLDFTPNIRKSLVDFVQRALASFQRGIAVEHILALLSSERVIESPPGESMDFESLEMGNIVRSTRKRISRVMTLPISMMSPRVQREFNLLEYDTEIICDHLTWIESDLFKCISITEYMNNNWLRDNKKILAPNLTNLSDHFNKVATWVSSIIITSDGGKQQAKLFHKFLRITRVSVSFGFFYR